MASDKKTTYKEIRVINNVCRLIWNNLLCKIFTPISVRILKKMRIPIYQFLM